MLRLRAIVVALAALVLAGCYVSTAPLIAPSSADYPIADGARFAAFAPAGAKWIPRPGRTVRRAGVSYVYVEDGRPKPSLPFLLKRIAPDLYVAQLSDHADPARVHEYAYELIHFDGTTAIQYSSQCAARPDWLKRHLVERIDATSTPRCVFSNFENLAIVLREAVKNAAPEGKYILTRPR